MYSLEEVYPMQAVRQHLTPDKLREIESVEMSDAASEFSQTQGVDIKTVGEQVAAEAVLHKTEDRRLLLIPPGTKGEVELVSRTGLDKSLDQQSHQVITPDTHTNHQSLAMEAAWDQDKNPEMWLAVREIREGVDLPIVAIDTVGIHPHTDSRVMRMDHTAVVSPTLVHDKTQEAEEANRGDDQGIGEVNITLALVTLKVMTHQLGVIPRQDNTLRRGILDQVEVIGQEATPLINTQAT